LFYPLVYNGGIAQMAIGAARLGEIEPRERVGAQTGRKYEYQYERTARAALGLLVDGPKHVCVYCDWHDDYVIEIGDPPTRYEFHQVKGRKSSQGPWTFRDFFGVSKTKAIAAPKKPVSVKANGILPLMLSHHKNFPTACSGLAFVTNAGLDPALSGFLEEIGRSIVETDLTAAAQIDLQSIARAYATADPLIASSTAELYQWLRGVKVHTDQGHLENVEIALLELADVVVEFSEIELLQRQAKQIAREIVGKIRTKVAHSSTVIPASDEQLQRDKGVVVAELLGILSLSAQAYEQLKLGAARDTVKTLSRLQRYCSKNGLENFIVQICDFKTSWDIWRTVERHFLASTDYILLEQKAYGLLQVGLTIERMVAEAKEVAKQFSGITATPLAPEHVMGLLFSLAAQSEAINNGSTGAT
jgi:Cap4 dsDNA endonuclease